MLRIIRGIFLREVRNLIIQWVRKLNWQQAAGFRGKRTNLARSPLLSGLKQGRKRYPVAVCPVAESLNGLRSREEDNNHDCGKHPID
jgi:hypothetical protein